MRDIQVNFIVLLEFLIGLSRHVGNCTELHCLVPSDSNALLTVVVCYSQIKFAIRSLTLFWTPILSKIPMLKLRAVRALTGEFARCMLMK